MWVNEEAECVEREGEELCVSCKNRSVCMSIVGDTIGRGCSVC